MARTVASWAAKPRRVTSPVRRRTRLTSASLTWHHHHPSGLQLLPCRSRVGHWCRGASDAFGLVHRPLLQHRPGDLEPRARHVAFGGGVVVEARLVER